MSTQSWRKPVGKSRQRSTKGIKKKLKTAIDREHKRVAAEAASITDPQSRKYHMGLAEEGYRGGYTQALCDVLLLLEGVQPDNNRMADLWRDD